MFWLEKIIFLYKVILFITYKRDSNKNHRYN